MRFCDGGRKGDGYPDQSFSISMMSKLAGKHSQELDRIRMIWLLGENLPINVFGMQQSPDDAASLFREIVRS